MSAQTRPGDALLVLATFVWLTIAVGPWWVGALLFAACWLLNMLHAHKMPRRG